MPPDVTFSGQSAQNSIAARVPPQTPLRELIALCVLPVFKGPTFKGRAGKREGRGRGKGKGRRGGREGRVGARPPNILA